MGERRWYVDMSMLYQEGKSGGGVYFLMKKTVSGALAVTTQNTRECKCACTRWENGQ